MTTRRTLRNEPCPCGSGRKYKHCCMRKRESLSGAIPQHRPVPGDGAALHTLPNPRKQVRPRPKPIARVSIGYGIQDAGGIDQPKVWEPPSQERDADGHFPRRIIGTVEYTGYFPTMDLCVGGEVIETTPGHLFFSARRRSWEPLESFRPGEMLRNAQGASVPIESMSAIRWQFGKLYNIEVEEFHTFFVGKGDHGGIWTHNGIAMGCRVPRAAVAEAIATRNPPHRRRSSPAR